MVMPEGPVNDNAGRPSPARQDLPFPVLADYAGLRHEGEDPRQRPAVTVVTVCRNAAASIERCIASVRGQDFQDYEHIVIDGASTDGTPAIARRMLRERDLLFSEPDKGISDAMNKGIALARGRYIQFVHADDWLLPGQLRAGVEALDGTDATYIFGDLLFFVGGVPDFLYRGDPNYAASIGVRMPALNHPTVVVRRSAFEEIGLFSLRYRCAMDYEWFLRLHRHGGRGAYHPEILGCMNHDGLSNNAFRRTMAEVRDISVLHGRGAVGAYLTFLYQVGKTGLGRVVRRVSAPAHRFVRQRINRSYRQLDPDIIARARS